MLAILTVAIAGLVLGSLSAWYSIANIDGVGVIRSGPWAATPYAGIEDVGPYAVAKSVIDGSVPLGATEGLSFSANVDSDGNTLQLKCNYAIEGVTPVARLWTLTAYDLAGKEITPATGGQSALFSGKVIRFGDGTFRIKASSRPQPGNWLATGGKGGFRLALRIYDTPVTASFDQATPILPSIRRVGCDA